jgi:heat shock protein 4
MSVVGIDFGNANSRVALARRKGIDVVLNDESKRETPAMLNFGETQRFIGCAAGDKINMQPQNTVTELKRLIGKKFDDAEVQEDIKGFLFPVSRGANGEIMIGVQYLGKTYEFTVERCVAMILADLKRIAEKDNGTKVTDCVISIPVFATDAQRRGMLDAAQITGLNVLRLLHETTATALAYGIFKTTEFTDEPTNVVFVDVGHSAMQVCVAQFTKKGLKILSTGFDRNCGGRDFDEVMFQHFCDEFKASKKIDIRTNARASLRLKLAIEKMKKILSANPLAPLNIECIMNDVDVNSMMTREKMEELAADTISKLMNPVETAVREAGLTIDDIAAVELVGNASRIPAISTKLESFFGKVAGRTMNASECVARGCALQGAMLSPLFRVREFEVQDSFPFPVSMAWTSDDGSAKEMELFERNNLVPSTKLMTFFKNNTFSLQASYVKGDLLSADTEPSVGAFEVGPFEAARDDGEKQKLKVKVRLNLNGLVSVESAQMIEEIEEVAPPEVEMKDDAAAAPADGADGMETDAPPPKEEKKVTKKVKKTDVPVKSFVGGLPSAILERFTNEEYDFALQDKVMEETKERKNAVEAYVYGMRSKIEDQLREYVDDATRESFASLLNATEDWLYEDGENEIKGVYNAKLAELEAIGEPIVGRAREETERPGAIAALKASASLYLEMCGDEAHAHIAAEDLEKVTKECNDALQWLDEKVAMQESTPKSQPAVLLSADIEKKRNTLERFGKPILSRPKPKPVKVEEPAAPEPMDGDGEAATAEDAAAEAGAEKDDEAMDDAADSLD